MAFCRWLSARLRFEVQLPTEWAWQWAAQSAQTNFAFPWGKDSREDFANTSKAGINGTSAVGIYPSGNSLQAVSDLSGNVWEWCLNEYENPNKVEPGGKAARVLRGGSWYDDPESSRAVFRFYLHPQYRYSIIGFRVVCRSHIHQHFFDCRQVGLAKAGAMRRKGAGWRGRVQSARG